MDEWIFIKSTGYDGYQGIIWNSWGVSRLTPWKQDFFLDQYLSATLRMANGLSLIFHDILNMTQETICLTISHLIRCFTLHRLGGLRVCALWVLLATVCVLWYIGFSSWWEYWRCWSPSDQFWRQWLGFQTRNKQIRKSSLFAVIKQK